MWLWPLKDTAPLLPDAPGGFGKVRKHDVHVGVDLYCEIGTEVIAVEDGVVLAIEEFTGPKAESPWWNETQAVLVKGASGVVTYGEVSPRIEVGDEVKAGQVVAVVETAVLRQFKGRPMVMLHFELMTRDATGCVWWYPDQPMPEVLIDPTPKLVEAGGGDVPVFNLETYDGKSFKP